jgi:hypothetical protein
MRYISLTCNHCDAWLEVPARTKLLTCPACSTELEVLRSDDTPRTKILDASETIDSQLELDKLDREWDEQKELYGSVGTMKKLQLITRLAMVAGIVLVAYGVTVDMRHLGGPGPGPVPYVCIFLTRS